MSQITHKEQYQREIIDLIGMARKMFTIKEYNRALCCISGLLSDLKIIKKFL